MHMLTANGIELNIKGKIKAEEQEKILFYHLSFGDVSIKRSDWVRRLELVFVVNFKEVVSNELRKNVA